MVAITIEIATAARDVRQFKIEENISKSNDLVLKKCKFALVKNHKPYKS